MYEKYENVKNIKIVQSEVNGSRTGSGSYGLQFNYDRVTWNKMDSQALNKKKKKERE